MCVVCVCVCVRVRVRVRVRARARARARARVCTQCVSLCFKSVMPAAFFSLYINWLS